MKIVSHRGFWTTRGEANSAIAFERAVAAGYGIETDLRDSHGQLIIAHDPPQGLDNSFEHFLAIAGECQGPLALNIKADGLAPHVAKGLRRITTPEWYVFDMSVPDMRPHLREGNPVYGRLSEVETSLPWPEQLTGIWLDAFDGTWFNEQTIETLLQDYQVCIVSPELHQRNHLDCWAMLHAFRDLPNISICTDFPAEADNYFN